MFSQGWSSLIKLLASILIASAITALAVGIRILELAEGRFLIAAALVVLSAVFLCILPASWNFSNICFTGYLGTSTCLVAAFGVQLWLFQYRGQPAVDDPFFALLLWGLAICLLILAAVIRDCQRQARACFNPTDWLLATLFLLLALGARLFGYTSLSVDESLVFAEMMKNYPQPVGPPWCTLASGFPCAIDEVVFAISIALRNAFDPIDTAKCLVLIASSLSIAAWFLTVRVFASRFVASAAATLLLFFGLHWVNSRFLYLYPYDMASLSIGTLCIALAFERKRLLPAVLAGAVLAFALTAKRAGLLMLPLYAFISFDCLISSAPKERKNVLKLSFAIVLAAAFTYAPMFFEGLSLGSHDRLSEAWAARANKLAGFGMTQSESIVLITADAFLQLFVKASDLPRHLLRLQGGLLDPAFSILFAVGAVAAILHARRQRSARLQIAGLLLGILGMVLAFPLDSPTPNGLARRMFCASFFIAWIGASGASILAARLVQPSRVAALTIGLCLTSLLINAYYLKAYYLRPGRDQWHYDNGGSRYELLRFLRTAAAKGINVIALDHIFLDVQSSHRDLPGITEVRSSEEVRTLLKTAQHGSYMVVTPPTAIANIPYSFYTDLSDTIPIQFWSDGPPDVHGVPQFRYAVLVW